jgi:hypothetical protein
MLVRILKDVFENEAYYDDLSNVLKNFRTGKHFLVVDKADDIDALKKSTWYEDLNSKDRKLIDYFLRTSTRKGNNLIITVSGAEPKRYFTPREADKYLDQPLLLLLENSDYDSPFLNAIFKYFDTDATLSNAKKEQWLKYSMGGGASIGSVVKGDIANCYIDDCFTKEKCTYLRYFVIIDSDKKYPEMSVNSSKTQILDESRVPYHILFKREKENYMPFAVLRSLKDNYLDLYLKFPRPDQKDFFDIGDGFKENRNKLQIEVQKLYPEDDVPPKNYDILKRGMTIEAYAKGQKFKAEFSKLFSDKLVTKNAMLEVINHQKLTDDMDEYEQIVAGIKKLL